MIALSNVCSKNFAKDSKVYFFYQQKNHAFGQLYEVTKGKNKDAI
jgi:hypothetical protein